MGGWWEQCRHDPDLVCLPAGAGWELSHVLQQQRFYHSSWASPSGQVLLGGYLGGPHGSSSNTSELLSTSSMDSADHFPLKYGVTA